jgi:hypothetical protein
MDTTTAQLALSKSPDYLAIAANVVIIIAGIITIIVAIVTISKGGFRLLRAANKLNQFVNKVECLINNFLPEIFDGLEKKGFLRSGTLARWTSLQAEILETKSPISITEKGHQIIKAIGFDKTYADNRTEFRALLKQQLRSTTNITEYDIEQASLKLVAELFDKGDAGIKSAETYSFNNPSMPISELRILLAIFVRDEILNDPDAKRELNIQVPERKQ